MNEHIEVKDWQIGLNEAMRYHLLCNLACKNNNISYGEWSDYNQHDTFLGINYEGTKVYRYLQDFNVPNGYYPLEPVGLPWWDNSGARQISEAAVSCKTFMDNGMFNIMPYICDFFHNCPTLDQVLKANPLDPTAIAAYGIYDKLANDLYMETVGNIVYESVKTFGKYVGRRDEPINQTASASSICKKFGELFSFAKDMPESIKEYHKDDFREIMDRLFCYRADLLLETTKNAVINWTGLDPKFISDILYKAISFETKVSGGHGLLPYLSEAYDKGEPQAEFKFSRCPGKYPKSRKCKQDNNNVNGVGYKFHSRCLRFEIDFKLDFKKDNRFVTGKGPVKAEIDEGAFAQGERRTYSMKFDSFEQSLAYLADRVVSDDRFAEEIKLDEV